LLTAVLCAEPLAVLELCHGEPEKDPVLTEDLFRGLEALLDRVVVAGREYRVVAG